MIRCLSRFYLPAPAAFIVLLAFSGGTAHAQDAAKPALKPTTGPAKPVAAAGAASKPAAGVKPAAATKPVAGAKPLAAAATPGAGQPVRLAEFGDWGAYASDTAKGKVCYALAKPKERLPKTLTRGDGYLFISNRPAEGVRNEVSMVLGFPTADGQEGSATIGTANFALITKGEAAWVKNAAEDAAFVDALRKGTSLTLKAKSKKGNESTDRYALNGLVQALDRVKKECP
jgi:hypothetical protein